MDKIDSLLTQYIEENKSKSPVREYQRLGYEIAHKLNDVKNAALYMRLAKNERVEILEQTMRFVIDYKNCTNPTALFLWKLKELKREHKFISVSNKRSVSIAVEALLNNKVIIFPTDTVYVMGCRLYSKGAIQKLYKAKKMSADEPVSVLISDRETFFEIVKEDNDEIEKVFNRYSSGVFTFVVPVRKPKLYPSRVVDRSSKTVRLKIPDYKWICDVINKLGEPVVVTSANLSRTKFPVQTSDISKDLVDHAEIVFSDEKHKMTGKSSKLIKIIDNTVEILGE